MDFIALDCEMVGVGPVEVYGPKGRDVLARVSLIDRLGHCIIDKFVKPSETVINYRTPISGIRSVDLEHGEPFGFVQAQVASLIWGKILIGHALKYDLAVLGMSYPEMLIRDTALYPPFIRNNNGKTPSLKKLAAAILGKNIQTGEHDSREDAWAAMQIYRRVAWDWENIWKKVDYI